MAIEDGFLHGNKSVNTIFGGNLSKGEDFSLDILTYPVESGKIIIALGTGNSVIYVDLRRRNFVAFLCAEKPPDLVHHLRLMLHERVGIAAKRRRGVTMPQDLGQRFYVHADFQCPRCERMP